MTQPAEIPAPKIRSSILIWGTALACFYIVFFLSMKFFNLVHITELRFVNYVLFFLTGFYQIHRLVENGKFYMPYLHGLKTLFLTGLWSFFLFSFFLYFYVRLDRELEPLFLESIPFATGYSPIPYLTIFAEGTAISIVTALTLMQYFRKYEEGDEKVYNLPNKKTDYSGH